MTTADALEAFVEFWEREPSPEQRAYIEAGVPVPFYRFKAEMATGDTVSPRLDFSLTLKENPYEQGADLQEFIDGLGRTFRELAGRTPTYVNGTVERMYDPRDWE